jgi:hypothetical protein
MARNIYLRDATRARVRLEREALAAHWAAAGRKPGRLEMNEALAVLAEVPSVFALAEKATWLASLNRSGYGRPDWAAQRWGNR